MTGETEAAPGFVAINRRAIVAGGLGMVAAPAVLRAIPVDAQSKSIKIGHVSPRTGPLAGFGEADGFILDQVRGILAKGLTSAGNTYPVEIISKDNQSSGTRASEVASELILHDKVDLIVASSAPETTNPVADQAEVNEVPCITTNCPWQPYFFGRNGDPKKGFTWTYHFFWGLEDVIAAFLALWEGQPTNKVIGGLFPNDADGNAWGDPQRGLPPTLAQAGYTLIDPGRYQLMNNDFTSQITRFKEAGAQIVTGNMIPPDFATFWSQAAQQNFHPRIVTIGKALLFPSVVNSLGPRGNGLSSEIWWTPNYPFKSGLTAQSAQQLRMTIPAPPSGRGRSRSAISTHCSKSQSMCSSEPKASIRNRFSMPSWRPITIQLLVRCIGPASRSRMSARRRLSPANGSVAVVRSNWSSRQTSRRHKFRSVENSNCYRSALPEQHEAGERREFILQVQSALTCAVPGAKVRSLRGCPPIHRAASRHRSAHSAAPGSSLHLSVYGIFR
jgi:branched-chain amino acid transport system substrate-binding protein